MKIAIGSDHAGYVLKGQLIAYLKELGHEVVDYGCHGPESTEYPRWIRPVAEAVAAGEAERGIVLGGSGNGEAIVANRVPGIRCGLCWDIRSARLTREHNDANVIAMGERMVTLSHAQEIVDLFLSVEFEGGRHQARIDHIDNPPAEWSK